ncbi:FAD-dependent oxidoreductase [Winogradskya humida]|uniref:3-(3-hydroxyphenyl)propionate hydroxylase n=1 Tax=Winogradskya humida TaxID=113566 RepID=A0ABQ3ZEJ6_9ACTN|nr:FAD-dependent oxidoreductase [Actinoplanes humidus]GIE16982.1 3-(3-hydroxyphenyl)propionate hydroxylase [Actinoplanes humidus]
MSGTTADKAVPADVLVIGAGPTGLTLACDLARRGVDVRVVERFDRPSVSSRGKGLQPRSLEILDDLGVAGDILTRGVTKLPVRMINADGTVVDREPIATPIPDPTTTPYPELVWIAEFDVEGPLRDRLALDGVHVEFATAATALEQHEDHVVVHVDSPRGPESIRARWVVGADGGKSTVRHCLGLPFDGFTMDDYWYLGDLRLEGLDHGRQYILPTPQGMIGLTPLPTTDLWQWQSTIKAGADLEEPTMRLYQGLLDDHLGTGRVTITDATWLSLYRANVRLAPRYRVGRVFLAGDAAHAHSPAGAQGMNTGIQDSWNLAWKLDAVLAGTGAELLDTYEQERRPVAAAVLELSTSRMRTFVDTAADGADGVNKGLAGMGGDVTTGLAISYPAGPVSLDGTSAERAPYAAGLRGPGFAGSTFDLFRGPHWTIIVFCDSANSTDSFTGLPAGVHVHRIGTGAILDPMSTAATRFGAGPDSVVLIRPDGYIAARVPLWEATRVRDHLQGLTTHQSVLA